MHYFGITSNITMADLSLQLITQVAVGDLVLSYNPMLGIFENTVVTDKSEVYPNYPILQYNVISEIDNNQSLLCSESVELMCIDGYIGYQNIKNVLENGWPYCLRQLSTESIDKMLKKNLIGDYTIAERINNITQVSTAVVQLQTKNNGLIVNDYILHLAPVGDIKPCGLQTV